MHASLATFKNKWEGRPKDLARALQLILDEPPQGLPEIQKVKDMRCAAQALAENPGYHLLNELFLDLWHSFFALLTLEQMALFERYADQHTVAR